jgi:transposase-like protein
MKVCKFCKGKVLVKCGMAKDKQRYLCKKCGKKQVPKDKRVKYLRNKACISPEINSYNVESQSIVDRLEKSFQLLYNWITKLLKK